MPVFLEENLKAPITHFSLTHFSLIFRSDSKLSHLNQQSEKVPPSLELVRPLNHVIKGMIEANSCKNRSKLFQPGKINHFA